MGDKLLVRAYSVGVGDCVYVRIPNGDDDFRILIDCGSKGRIALVKSAVKHLEDDLRDEGGSGVKPIDLLVVTHRHQDHIKGFDPKIFKNIPIKNIWLTVAMNEDHIQAEKSLALNDMATTAMRGIEARGLSLSAPLQTLVSMYSINNENAMKALRVDFPKSKGATPVYVHAGMGSDDLPVALDSAKIHVLAPENDIDGYYLGEDVDEALRGFRDEMKFFTRRSASLDKGFPENISPNDFRMLQSRMLSNAFAFAEKDSSIQNNVSVVLLVEWRGRRLLFTGDAEWEGKFRTGKHNGSWNVMWKERSKHLEQPVDFLKIGHHGSINATPWAASKDPDYEVNQILDAILPLPSPGAEPVAKALVSTKRSTVYPSIPAADLLVELGKRVANTKVYFDELKRLDPDFENKAPFDEYWDYELLDCLKQSQPWRTDLESTIIGKAYVDVEFEPVD
jgi:beta-lactamase superfamily II metal-dependent hydrolase